MIVNPEEQDFKLWTFQEITEATIEARALVNEIYRERFEYNG